MFGFGQTVTVLRPADLDENRDPTGPPTPRTVDGCGIAWQETSKDSDRRETVESRVQLFCPPNTDILATDRVVLPDGNQYDVDGQPASWHSPFTGWEPGIVVRLKGVF